LKFEESAVVRDVTAAFYQFLTSHGCILARDEEGLVYLVGRNPTDAKEFICINVDANPLERLGT
jgi:hypothetical protein